MLLKEILPFVPFGLKAFQKYEGLDLFSDVNQYNATNYIDKSTLSILIFRDFDMFSPILINGQQEIPLLCLQKLITGKEGFIWRDIHDKPIGGKNLDGWLLECYYEKEPMFMLSKNGKKNYMFNQYKVYEWLFENKFDVFRKIDSGEALSANKFTINPYNN